VQLGDVSTLFQRILAGDGVFDFRGSGGLCGNLDRELGSVTQFAVHADGSSHRLRETADKGQSDARTLEFAGR